MRQIIFFIIGFFLLTIGMTEIVHEWPSVVGVFKGFIGIVIAVFGLVVLFAASLKKGQ